MSVEIIITIISAVVGGSISGWTVAHNKDGNPMRIPMIFHTIDPLWFILLSFAIPTLLGFILLGVSGIFIALVVAWIASGIIGNWILNKLRRR